MKKIPKIKLYELGPTRSSRVRWVLQEAELHYESIQNGVEIFKSQELLSIHPLGKLPAVIIDNKPLFESAAIVTAIADLVPDKCLIAKTGSWSRHLHDQWVCFALSEMEPFVNSTEINTSDFVLTADQHVSDIVPQNNHMYRKAATAVEKHLIHNSYLVDDTFSATDIVMGYTLLWGQEQKLLDEYPNINSYMERLFARPHCALPRPV